MSVSLSTSLTDPSVVPYILWYELYVALGRAERMRIAAPG
jgi:hypothetical protein